MTENGKSPTWQWMAGIAISLIILFGGAMVADTRAELALKASSATLAPDLTQGVISETVGPISVTYDKNSPQATRYKAIDMMLQPFLRSGGGVSVRLERT